MAEVIHEKENLPDEYPDPPTALSTGAEALDPAAVWTRIESWIIHRWPIRTVQWIVQGPGWFVPRLKPAELVKAESWTGMGYEDVEPDPAPFGLSLNDGVYRLTYDIGETTPPASVLEAYRRLAEYWAETGAEGGATSITDGDYSVTRSANAVGRALQYSGAADLLRAYRR